MVSVDVLRDPLVQGVFAIGLAGLLVIAGAHKLRDAEGFARVLRGYGAALGGWPDGVVRLLGVLVPTLELLAGAGVLLSAWWPLAALPALALLVCYATLLALASRPGRGIADCGCHWGSRPQAPSAAMAVRNLVLSLPALALLLPVHPRPLVWFDAISLVGALAGAVVLYLLANLLVANRTSLNEMNTP